MNTVVNRIRCDNNNSYYCYDLRLVRPWRGCWGGGADVGVQWWSGAPSGHLFCAAAAYCRLQTGAASSHDQVSFSYCLIHYLYCMFIDCISFLFVKIVFGTSYGHYSSYCRSLT